MKKKQVGLCLAALLLAVLSAFSACASSSPSMVREEFEDNGENQPYSQQIPLEEMDFSVYDDVFPDMMFPVYKDPEPMKIELPCDVEYYKSKGDKTPAITLEKGTVVFFASYDSVQGTPIGYGCMGWPDYEEGWRYAVPFSEFGFAYTEKAEGEMYYVKTSQLMEVSARIQSEFFSSYAQPEKHEKNRVLFVDQALYFGGAFCSPDIEKYYVKREDINVT